MAQATHTLLEELDDRRLIRRFHRQKEEQAFALLVQRHGPMVLRVCRKSLASEQDAEDAYQAVFMVLARKAGRVRWEKCLAKWLYGVTLRICLKARSNMQNRPRQQSLENESLQNLAEDNSTSPEWFAEAERILYEEIDRLPANLQEPILLCSLEGCSRQQAAETLGVRESTLKGRLERARELLKTRMLRREIVLPAVVLTGGLIPTAAEAGFSTSLIFSPTAVATNLTTGTAVSGQLGVTAVKLAQGELATMLMITKLKIVAATVAVAMMVGSGSLLLPSNGAGEEAKEPEKISKTAEENANKKLIGQWDITSVQDGGKVRELDSSKANKFIFTENSLTMFANGRAKKTLYTIDVSHTPHWIDLGGGEVMKGIFEVSEGELKFCLNEHPGEPRPDKFESAGGSSPNDLLMIARRTNPVSGIKEKLLGEWQIVTAKEGGNVRELEVDKTNQFIFSDKKNFKMITSWQKEGKVYIRHTAGTYKIDSSQKPNALDLDMGNGEVLKAILELSGDDFKFRVNYQSGASRPDDFESKPVSPNELLMTARRVKSSD